tara:strand:+ start:107348 stop:107515 length:168 start_codon:yes stop_codon:yes gene_type:complete
MNDWSQIKRNLIKEIKSTINTIDPAFNVDESVELKEVDDPVVSFNQFSELLGYFT